MKNKIISQDPRSFVTYQKFKICKITNDDRIMASSNTSSYKKMISQDLNSEIIMKGKNNIHLKNKLVITSKFGKLSKNHSFTVEACLSIP